MSLLGRARSLNYQGKLYDKFPTIYNIHVIAITATVSGLMFGFDISSVSSFVSQEHYRNYFNRPDSLTQGGITASMAGGSFVGSLVSSDFQDIFGRRVALHVCSALWITGAIIQSASQNQGMLIAGRFISGLGIGFGSASAPVYCSEVSPAKIRGLIGGLFQLSVTVGIMVMFYIGYGCHFIDGVASFRLAWGLQMIPGFILLVGVFFIPESPRWLANHERWDDAVEIIANVVADGDREDPDVHLQLDELQEQVLIDKDAANFGYADLFKKDCRKRTFIGVSAQIWQQLCGMNVMMYYIVYIFEMAGYSGNVNLVSSSIQYVLNVVMTIPALFLMDRVGRRPLLIGGGIFMFIWLFGVAGLLATYSEPIENFGGDDTVRILIPDEHKAAARGVIACSYLFVCSFAPTWGICIWVYVSEIFNNRQRAKGAALATSANWIFNFALAMFVPSAFRNITWRTYIIFGVFSVCLTVHVIVQFPETRGKTLEEIDKMFKDNIPAWRTSSYVPEMPIVHKEKIGSTEHIENASNLSEKPIMVHEEESV
ncbi:Glucose sensor or transporter [Komagataella phaffii]|uniref:Transporter, member of the sugar porter family n=2 Tax=Komagataella phaffii TaxID=460519 RepID=C4R3B7_KOMPG|nr:Putative transporter, member of the sugar porter family [Komagataella phaffii GS115]AOA63259.1 GQ67_03034T0 [Komagataella phaffii]AOA69201.1 GQ68_03019T0 [Komagataella phaffii GS115]CAY69952.1 Putative transporter, member of the sugar porter family [Komagataella phaffii GS115]